MSISQLKKKVNLPITIQKERPNDSKANTKDLQLILQLSILSQLGFTKEDLKEIYLIEKVK